MFQWNDPIAWKRASKNTFTCLIGCSIGDFGMIIYIQANHPETPIFTMMVLAMITGLITSIILETILLKIREGFDWMGALKLASNPS